MISPKEFSRSQRSHGGGKYLKWVAKKKQSGAGNRNSGDRQTAPSDGKLNFSRLSGARTSEPKATARQEAHSTSCSMSDFASEGGDEQPFDSGGHLRHDLMAFLSGGQFVQ